MRCAARMSNDSAVGYAHAKCPTLSDGHAQRPRPKYIYKRRMCGIHGRSKPTEVTICA
jgi:hypothetical protein